MPDAPAIIPPPAFNPVIGPVLSMVEREAQRATGQPLPQQLPHAPANGGVSDPAFNDRLNAARNADRSSISMPAPASQQSSQQQQQPPAQAANGEPLLQPRSQRQQKNLRSADWEAKNQQINQLQQQLSELQRNNGQQPAFQPNGQPSAPPPLAQSQQQPLVQYDIEKDPRYVELKQKHDTYYEEIKHVRVEADPEFRAKFDTKRDAAIRIAKSVAGGAGDDIARILGINDPDVRQQQLADRIKDFSEGSKQRIIAANAALAGVDVEREIEIQSRKAQWESTKAQREQSNQQQLAQSMQKMDREFDAVAASWSDPDNGVPFMYDQNVRARVEPIARQFFSGSSTPRQLAEASLKAALFPELIRSYMHTFTELERVQASNNAYRSSYPGSDAGGGYSGTRTGDSSNGAATTINPTIYDRGFADRLEAARSNDAANANRHY